MEATRSSSPPPGQVPLRQACFLSSIAPVAAGPSLCRFSSATINRTLAEAAAPELHPRRRCLDPAPVSRIRTVCTSPAFLGARCRSSPRCILFFLVLRPLLSPASRGAECRVQSCWPQPTLARPSAPLRGLPRLIHRTGPGPKVSSAQPPLLFLLGQEVSAHSFFPVAVNLAIFHRIAILQKSPC
ncbi:hypothetical protein VPH35_002037 [Triticum aestivum]